MYREISAVGSIHPNMQEAISSVEGLASDWCTKDLKDAVCLVLANFSEWFSSYGPDGYPKIDRIYAGFGDHNCVRIEFEGKNGNLVLIDVYPDFAESKEMHVMHYDSDEDVEEYLSPAYSVSTYFKISDWVTGGQIR